MDEFDYTGGDESFYDFVPSDEGGWDFSQYDFGGIADALAGYAPQALDLYRGFTGPSGPSVPSPGFVPAGAPAPMTDDGMIPTGIGGALVGAGAGAGIWLSTFLARALGRGVASAIFTGANGIRVRISQLWPLTRKYGPAAVSSALGITLGALGTLLAQAPTTGPRRRARGISGRDVKTTRRTIKQLRRLTRMAGIKVGGGGYRRRAPARRGYYC